MGNHEGTDSMVDNNRGKPPVVRTRRVKSPGSVPKRKRVVVRTKVAGWEKGILRSACFYVQAEHHQAVTIASAALRVSKGVIVERAVVDYLATNADLEQLRPALESILYDTWPEDEEGEEE